ncbi:peptidoglycan-recognition protein LC isoform X5 [Drosophila persimilis]|uniref:peptidoglycan-recognition protein LC isoform X5 n=1 Tax=Drosophila persimilis TaxID=7234 RepID=UPI000F077363|nr:peptidoglycan-recognition protein LC isoform X5 [Drosophila persimilis]
MLDSALECCQKCRGVIATIPSRIKCDNGLCSRVLHSQCTGLTKEQLKLLETIPNLSSKCDGCLGSNQNQSSLQLSKWLEQSLRQHEKRLEVLEQRSKLDDPGQQAPMLCPYLPNTISRKAISITVAFVLLTTLLGIILATTTNLFGKTLNKSKLGDVLDDSRLNIPINSTIDQDNIGGGLILRFVHRQAWLAQPPQKTLADLMLPVSLVIVLPTNSDNCSTQAQCVLRVRLRQTFDIESLQEDDIAFNFVIGGDGNVYVGRGWNQVGAHMSGYNVRSLSFAYIGSFQNQKPSAKQLSVTHLLLERGVSLGKISPNYRLTGASKLEPSITEYKADQLYQSFSNWTHWS